MSHKGEHAERERQLSPGQPALVHTQMGWEGGKES